MNIRQLGFISSILLMTLFLLSCRDLRWLRGSVEKKLIGEWEGVKDNSGTWSFIFNKDGSWMFVSGNTVLPPTSDEQIVVDNVSWEFDDTQDPIHLDCIMFIKYKESGEKKRKVLPMIIRFVGQDKIQVRMTKERPYDVDNTISPPTMYFGKRPTGFLDESDDQIILTRQ